ncbi:bifunctional lysylphosphatidylglycerol flippase/synthetase MprF [Occultella kanbiaonis]|uniref:bifunctional lysylphosphatidylglycerol flippase/synthetase MprF n=1 Tax=Occultella kanbiaonis TaxID=2675754 RepID=UPI0013D19B08|nr:phosphatidylglycerol lysyltransferase domain-containing protein [Occultella kanbiaonis]
MAPEARRPGQVRVDRSRWPTRGIGASQWLRHDRSRRVATYAVVVLAVLGLLSAASDPLRGRVRILLEVVPLVVPETAALTLIFVSFALLLTARGLRRGHRLGWVAAEALLVTSVVLHLSKGLDVEEAALAAGGAVWLARNHRAFPVLASRAALTRAALVGVGGVAVTLAVSLGLAVRFGTIDASDLDESARAVLLRLGGWSDLPLPFMGAFAGPILTAVGLGLLGSVLWVLLSPVASAPLVGEAHRQERERARAVVSRYGGGSLDYFALRDDKQWFFTGHSVVAHAVRGAVCVVSPDPIGPPEERAEVWAELTAHAERHGWSVTVLGAAQEWLNIYESSGLRSFYLGDEAIVDCATFDLTDSALKSLRRAHRRVVAAGFTVSFLDPATLDGAARAELVEVAVRSRQGEAEHGFSMTLSRLFDPADLGLVLAVARDSAGQVQAFIQWVPAPRLPGWSLDTMRRSPTEGIPNGVIDFLVIESIRHLAARGGASVALNFAVLHSVVAGDSDAPTSRLARSVLRRASSRMQIESLWRFNAKYRPRWVPRYAAVGSMDLLAAQGLAIADVEGLTGLPVVGRFLGHPPPS